MKQAGECGATRWTGLARLGYGLALCLLVGCAAPGTQGELARSPERSNAEPRDEASAPYRVGCPDELEISVSAQPPRTSRHVVGPDGRIEMGNLGQLHVDGKTTTQIAAAVATRCGATPDSVYVIVHAYRSQQVYLVGEIRGPQRAVPYQGPERVVELLERAGGLTSGAALGDVFLLRSHLTEGRSPEVLRIDVRAIVSKRDQRTNYVVEPFDEIVVGESRQSILARSLPPWMLPFYQSLFGLQQ
jgi:polysaccharide export outer membrane protein